MCGPRIIPKVRREATQSLDYKCSTIDRIGHRNDENESRVVSGGSSHVLNSSYDVLADRLVGLGPPAFRRGAREQVQRKVYVVVGFDAVCDLFYGFRAGNAPLRRLAEPRQTDT